MPTRTLTVTVIRPEDLLLLRLDFVDVDFTAGSPPQIAGQAGARLIAHFQPQHIAEQAFFEVSDGAGQEQIPPGTERPPLPGNDLLPAPGSVQSRLAGPTRLAFNVPAGTSFPLTVEGVLEALRTLPLNVTAVARYEPPSGCAGCSPMSMLIRRPPPRISTPARFETAIELPYRLQLSPDQMATWSHAAAPVEHDGRVELWHTRLGTNRANNDPRVRAVWSPDYKPNPQPHVNEPFRMSLDARDRNELVQLTSNYYLDSFTPTPVRTNRMMLTTLGGWLDVFGRWRPPAIPADPPEVPPGRRLTVEEWKHLATMGRDHFVKVVYAGFLFPIGHRASLVKITERKFARQPEGPGFIAYDFQRMYIIVRERRRTYDPRDCMFRTIDVETEETPSLAKPEDSDIMGEGLSAFWPRYGVGGAIEDFPFAIVGYDWEGEAHPLTTPLLFITADIDSSQIDGVLTAYNTGTSVDSARRTRSLGGRTVAYAPADKPGDTSYETATISFAAEKVVGSEQPHFRPRMAKAGCDIPAAKQLLGKSVISTIEYEPTYTSKGGWSIGNAGQVFAHVTNNPPLKFDNADKSGGLVTPDIGISGLSRSLGPVGGPVNQMVAGSFNPTDIFGAVELLGGIKLSDIIRIHNFADASSAGNSLPNLLTVRDGNILRTTYRYVLPKSELIVSDLFTPNDNSVFSLEAIVEKRIDDPSPPVLRTIGRLTNFTVALLPAPEVAHLVDLTFTEVKFTAETGKKLDTSVQLGGITFVGILEFVDRLRTFIPSNGFQDPPSLELTPDPGVKLGFSIGIPTIGIGIMTMQNISLSASFFLPLTGSPPMSFRFAFCERHQPFTLTVMMFGGGGFFAITISLKGVTLIEASLEFGASIALNLGVASGSASIMAGFYFQMTDTGDFSLTGYFRACGSLSVLGIITVTVEFYLGLTYASKGIVPHGGHLWGQCRVTVKIEILFFSISVGITLEREFAGSDPTFRQLIETPVIWGQYCDSFADYPVVVGE